MARHRKSKGTRRGRPTQHAAFGEQQVDLGDAIYSERFSERFSERRHGRDLDAWSPPAPDEVLAEKEMHEDVLRQLKTLTPREQFVIKHHFGIGCEPITIDEIGELLGGVAGHSVRYIEKEAFEKLYSLKQYDSPSLTKKELEWQKRSRQQKKMRREHPEEWAKAYEERLAMMRAKYEEQMRAARARWAAKDALLATRAAEEVSGSKGASHGRYRTRR